MSRLATAADISAFSASCFAFPSQWDKNGFPLHEQRWRQTKLSALVLDPHTLWHSGPNTPKQVFSTLSNATRDGPEQVETVREEAEVLGDEAAAELRLKLDDPTARTPALDAASTEIATVDDGAETQQIAPPARIDDFPIPRYLSQRLVAADREFLFRTLPKTAAAASVPLLPTVNLTPADAARRATVVAAAEAKETPRLEAMARILSLRNASAREIRRESVSGIVKAFGQPEVRSFLTTTPKERKGPDTGSMEVQSELPSAVLPFLPLVPGPRADRPRFLRLQSRS